MPRGVEVLKVHRGARGEPLRLAVPQSLPAAALARVNRLLEAAAGCLQRRQLGQRVGMALHRQTTPTSTPDIRVPGLQSSSNSPQRPITTPSASQQRHQHHQALA